MDTPDGHAHPPDNGQTDATADAAADALDRELARHVQGQARRLANGVALAFSALMHLTIGAFVFSSGQIAPGWAVGALIGVWTAGTWGIWRFRRVPEVVLIVPMAVAAIWWGTIAVGQRFLGWTV